MPREADAGLLLQRPLYVGLTNGLVGYWSFDGPDMAGAINTFASPRRAYDRSGNGNTGNYYNATGTPPAIGRIGQALEFDGVNDAVDLASPASLDDVNVFTYAAWIKPRSKGEVSGRIYDRNLKSFLLDDTNTFQVEISRATTNAIATAVNNTIIMNEWNFVVATFDSSNAPRLFHGTPTKSVAEVSYATQSAGSGTIDSEAGAKSMIGNYQDASTRTFDGLIDDVRVYNRALSQAEITRLYRMGATLKVNVSRKDTLTKDLVGYWTFDGPDMAGAINNAVSARRAYDRSGNGNTGSYWNATGTPPAIGRIGQALEFGQGLYVDINTAVVSGTPFSICIWFRHNNTVDYDSAVFIGDKDVTDNFHALELRSGNVRVASRTAAGLVSADTTVLYKANTWHHACGVWSSATSRTAYIDGGNPVTNTTSRIPAGLDSTNIGRLGDSTPGNYVTGLIDDVRVYKRVLSADEIKRLYNIGATLKVNVSRKDTLTNGLVGYWSFDGPDMAKNTAYDRSGQGNNGTLTNGPVRAVGRIGQALEFDGSDDYVNLGNPTSLQITGSMSISAWVYKTAALSSDRFVSRKGAAGNRSWELFEDPSPDGLRFSISSDGSDAETIFVSYDEPNPKGRWIHVVGTYEPSVALRIYVDGILRNSNTTSIPASQFNSTLNPRIGSRADGISGTFMTGLIDDARVYNRALSADEIRRLYNMGR